MKKFPVFLLAGLASVLLAASPLPAQQQTAVSADGVKIAYTVTGKGEPTLVFVHGWCCDQTVWKKQVDFFSKTNQVITLDLAGHGLSGKDRKDYTFPAFGQDVAAVVKACGAKRVILIGHSMSGIVILEAEKILKDSVIGLVGIDTLQNVEHRFTDEQKQQNLAPMKADFKKASDGFVRTMFPPTADPALVNEVAGKMSSADPAMGVQVMERIMNTDTAPLLAGAKAPVWSLNADLWPSAPEINQKYAPTYQMRIISGVGHFLMLEKPADFNAQLNDIVSRLVTASQDKK